MTLPYQQWMLAFHGSGFEGKVDAVEEPFASAEGERRDVCLRRRTAEGSHTGSTS